MRIMLERLRVTYDLRRGIFTSRTNSTGIARTGQSIRGGRLCRVWLLRESIQFAGTLLEIVLRCCDGTEAPS